MNKKLILIRHGQSQWNLENRFTGWHDIPLTEQGEIEAIEGGKLLLKSQLIPKIIHTSVLTRAQQTAKLVIAQFANSNIEVKESWTLNERHYGNLTGKNKKEAVEEFGEEQVFSWRRKYSIRPPEIAPDNEYGRGISENHSDLIASKDLPKTECLKDVTNRLLPYFEESIKPDLKDFSVVLIVAHGNSLRALIKHLDDISDDDIADLNLPTAIPLVYELDDNFMPTEKLGISERYLGSAKAAQEAAERVARQIK